MSNKNLIIDRIRDLRKEKELNRWSFELQNFFDVYRQNRAIISVIDSILEKKKSDYIAYFKLYENCIKEANVLFRKLKKCSVSSDHLHFPVFKCLRRKRIKELTDPFLSPEGDLDGKLRKLEEFIFNYFHNDKGIGKNFNRQKLG